MMMNKRRFSDQEMVLKETHRKFSLGDAKEELPTLSSVLPEDTRSTRCLLGGRRASVAVSEEGVVAWCCPPCCLPRPKCRVQLSPSQFFIEY